MGVVIVGKEAKVGVEDGMVVEITEARVEVGVEEILDKLNTSIGFDSGVGLKIWIGLKLWVRDSVGLRSEAVTAIGVWIGFGDGLRAGVAELQLAIKKIMSNNVETRIRNLSFILPPYGRNFYEILQYLFLPTK